MMKLSSKLFTAVLLLAFHQAALALPPLWETNYNVTELNGTSGNPIGPAAPSRTIDGQENIALGFSFPFGGNTYTRISVDADGGIVLKNDLTVTDVSRQIWRRNSFEPSFSNIGQGSPLPVILPFGGSLNQLVTTGRVYYAFYNGAFNGFTGARGVITWEDSSLEPFGTPDVTVQAILLGDGTIIFNYQVLSNVADWDTKDTEGIVVGVSNGDGTWPQGSQNLTAPSDFGTDLIAYEIWCKNDNPVNPSDCMQSHLPGNDGFDLHDRSIVFNPDGATGFLVSSGPGGIKDGAGAGGSNVCAVVADSGNTSVTVAGLDTGGGGGGGGSLPLPILLLLYLLVIAKNSKYAGRQSG